MGNKKNSKNKSKTLKTSSSAKTPISNVINTEIIAAALSTVNQPVFLKVCRLCESKDGPFLNIFESEKVIAKKIEELMPFWIGENDDLPHKICFRCSAKVEELHEFVQKCVHTQENLRKALGKREPLPVKSKTRALWEQKLNKSNMSNEDICDALIKKAMEGIKDIPILTTPVENEISRAPSRASKSVEKSQKIHKNNELVVEALKETKTDEKPRNSGNIKNRTNLRPSQTSHVDYSGDRNQNSQVECPLPLTRNSRRQQSVSKTTPSRDSSTENNKLSEDNTPKQTDSSIKIDASEPILEPVPKEFDIMDHVSMIKVNGVGILFQCKLCNRNFLKKEVVMSHACAKTGVPKIDLMNMYSPPEPPKVTTVKYINTKPNAEEKPTITEQKNTVDNDTSKSSASSAVVKRKIGPASKIGRKSESSNSNNENQQTSNTLPNDVQSTKSSKTPVYNLPSAPNLNIRYKLLPGPNNTFSLIEDKLDQDEGSSKKRNSPEVIDVESETKPSSRNLKTSNTYNRGDTQANSNNHNFVHEISTVGKPYPVGLFQTVAHHCTTFTHSANNKQVPFTTPAMKKQSYSVVQTGNPSKLLISNKPQHTKEYTNSRKRPKRAKSPPKNDVRPQEPFSVILEDTAHPKDPGFFSFINVDPLLQPSYVLPTDNIIQESQISTTHPKAGGKETESDKYSCNICGEKFNREKKLNAHVLSHYNFQEDNSSDERSRKRRK